MPLDPISQSILLSIVGNVLTDVAKLPFTMIKARIDNAATDAERHSTTVPKLVERGIAAADATLEDAPNIDVAEMSLFLRSDEVATQIRRLFAHDLREEIGDPRPLSIEQIQDKFLHEFNLFFGRQPGEEERLWLIEAFEALVDGVEDILRLQLGREFEAFEALERFRQIHQFHKLSEIHKELQDLKSAGQLNVADVIKFESKLRSQIAEVHGKIIPPSFGDTKKIPIDTVYVTPFLFEVDQDLHRSEYAYDASLFEFLCEIETTLVVGNPGAGKTTLTDKICYQLSTFYDLGLVGGRLLTPLHVTLRKYSEERIKSHISIRDFVERDINARYQVPAPKGAVDYMLVTGRCLVVFDGLDELLEVGMRREIVNDIEAFINLYPLNRILVTSREVGYQKAPFSENRFTVFKIAPFTPEQTQSYVQKWFDTNETISAHERVEKAANFLKESVALVDLRSNPLMLSLMCLLYKGEGFIPANRPDLYDKCARMLFETWDRTRNIRAYKPFEDYFRSTLMHIAFFIYTEESQAEPEEDLDEYSDAFYDDEIASERFVGFNEKAIVDVATKYLRDYFDTDELAENYARDLIEFCKGRAWVFTDVGEDSYNFTHRTFLEYFTASHLVRSYPQVQDLFDFLLPKLKANEWISVAQLALQIKNQAQDKAADAIVELFLRESRRLRGANRSALRSFVLGCLQFINFSTASRLEIFRIVGEELKADSRKVTLGRLTVPNPNLRTLLDLVATANSSNMNTINRLLLRLLTGPLKVSSKSKFATLVALDLPNLEENRSTQLDLPSPWTRVSDSILEHYDAVLSQLASADVETAICLTDIGRYVPHAITQHGERYLISSQQMIYSRKAVPPVILQLLSKLIDSPSPIVADAADLIGRQICSQQNLFTSSSAQTLSITDLMEHTSKVRENIVELLESGRSPYAFLGMFWLFACLFERERHQWIQKLLDGTDLGSFFLARSSGNWNSVNQQVLTKFDLKPQQTNLLKGWIERTLNFVRYTP